MSVRLRVSVVALFAEADRVLLLHQMTPPEPDCWDLPGGGLEPSEDLITSLKREVREETGIVAFEVERLLTVTEGFYSLPHQVIHSLNLIYQCRLLSPMGEFIGDPQEVGPGGVRWMPMAELRQHQCSSRAWQALAVAGLTAIEDPPHAGNGS